jgi:hypothetical protein
MSGLFVLLFLLALILLPVSLIKPSIFSRFAKKDFSRKQLGLIFGTLIITSLVLIGITAPPTTKQESQVKGDRVEQQAEQTNQLPVISPEPTEIATPSPSPVSTPKPTPTPKLASPTPQNTPIISTQPKNDCNPSYPDVCIPNGAADYDCAGGSGNGPNYIKGPIRVLSPDPYGLDRDHDGIGCES